MSPPITAPQIILDLVARFDEHRDTYRRDYNETQVRRDFLDPFFEALGWDVNNRQGYAEAYREVIHEDALRVEKTVKAPDYCFRVGGTRKFFVEAKKPSVDIAREASPAFQLRRYAWTAKLPLSILTDFEELAVYDCRVKPDKTDKASTARVLLLKYTDYATRWQEIVDIFSQEAIKRGSFDKYAESNRRKRGTAEVDDAFLEEIETWRESLAKNISLRNPHISERELNDSVQKIIDRVIFLRLCEGRGIEHYGQLQALVNGSNVYPRLVELFRKADDKYNSGLFHFSPEKGREPPDELTTQLQIDDKVLKEIFVRLYYPESPYEFAALPSDILGQVYEQFLGKVIRLTTGHRAKVEEKPEVRKAGGVYYTPTYIVDYIVANTVGKLVEGKTPQQVGGLTDKWKPAKNGRPLTVLDPACGSGSFLIVAYQFLLDWYFKQYTESSDPASHAKGANPRLYHDQRGEWRLTTAERKRILLSHIYGVDIDGQAVEVTKLSLLLKVLEGETEESLAQQRRLFHNERALPDLANNIKCGNSLIGSDFYHNQQLSLLDEDERLRINVFDWDGKDGFREIMQSGGFDAVIGNPPYIDSEWMTTYLQSTREYCVGRYAAATGNWDIFCVFTERAIKLCRPSGLSSFIVPNKLGAANYAEGARRVLAVDNSVMHIRDYSHISVFPVAVYPIVYVARAGKTTQPNLTVGYERMRVNDRRECEVQLSQYLDYDQFFANPETPWEIFVAGGNSGLIKRLKQYPKLESTAKVFGAATVAEAYEIAQIIYNDSSNDAAKTLRLVNSGTIDRYANLWGLKPCRYLGEQYLHPVVLRHELSKISQRRLEHADAKKVIVAGMTKQLESIIDDAGEIVAGKSTTIVISDYPKIFGAILNSKVVNFVYNVQFGGNKLQGGYLRVGPPQIKKIPIPVFNQFCSGTAKQIESAVDQILALHKRLGQVKTAHEKTALQRQIDGIDRQIDQLVYQLYELTDDEIRLVEEATQ